MSRHADERVSERGLSTAELANLVLTRHRWRRRNVGSADWIVRGHGMAAAYNWPDRGDRLTARIVTGWQE